MARKRTSLDSILPPAESSSSAAGQVPSQPPRQQSPKKKQLAVLLEQPVYQQLRTIAFEEETKMHPLILEGLDRVFADRGLASIQELKVKDS